MLHSSLLHGKWPPSNLKTLKVGSSSTTEGDEGVVLATTSELSLVVVVVVVVVVVGDDDGDGGGADGDGDEDGDGWNMTSGLFLRNEEEGDDGPSGSGSTYIRIPIV